MCQRYRKMLLTILAISLFTTLPYSVWARTSIQEILTKGSKWHLTLDGESGTLKLRGGRGSRTRDGGWLDRWDVEWNGRPGKLYDWANKANTTQGFLLEVEDKDGHKEVCKGSVSEEPNKFIMKGVTLGHDVCSATRKSDIEISISDKTPPQLWISYSPTNPTSDQQLTFSARARDSGGIKKVNILVNARIVKECTTSRCSYTGGPYPPGTVTYGANAYDKAGNRAWTRYKSLTVTEVKPKGNSTISGSLTGNRDLVKRVAAYNLDDPKISFNVRVDANGRFTISNIPDGRYRVYPFAGKVEVLSNPKFREVECRGNQHHRVNFEIVSIFEG